MLKPNVSIDSKKIKHIIIITSHEGQRAIRTVAYNSYQSRWLASKGTLPTNPPAPNPYHS